MAGNRYISIFLTPKFGELLRWNLKNVRHLILDKASLIFSFRLEFHPNLRVITVIFNGSVEPFISFSIKNHKKHLTVKCKGDMIYG